MKEEYTEKVIDLEDTGQRLMLVSAEQLLCGEHLDIQNWQSIVSAYEEIVSMGQIESSNSASTLFHAIGQLAYIITSSNSSTAIHSVAQIAPDPDLALPRDLAQVIVAKRRSELFQQQPVYHLEFAEKLYRLGSHVKNRECITQGGQIIAEILAHALELFSQQNNLANAIETAVLFVGMANELASKPKIPIFMQKALYWGEQVIEANTPSTAENWPVLALAANLVNTCNWLAGTYPSDKQEYIERGIAVAEYWRNAVQVVSAGNLEHEQYLMMLKRSSDALMLLYLRLATTIPDRFYVQANKLWKTLREYLDLAEQHKDPDLESKSFSLPVVYYMALKELQSDWVPPIIRFRQEDIILPEVLAYLHFGVYTKLRKKQAAEIANQIIVLSDIIQQQEAIEEILGLWYSELEYLLPKIISEVGLNFYVCHLILILGLVASGRIDPLISQPVFSWSGSLTSESIFDWKWDSTQNNPSSHHSQEILDRQQLSPKQYDIEEKNSIGTILGLSEFAETLRHNSELVDIVHRTFRKHNATLLRNIVSSNKNTQLLDNIALMATKDLYTLGRGLSIDAKQSILNTYNKTDI